MSAHTFLRAVKVNMPLSSGILTDFGKGVISVMSTVEAMTVTNIYIYMYIYKIIITITIESVTVEAIVAGVTIAAATII